VILPARAASTRLPNKPLVEIAGTPMLKRVIGIAKSVTPSCEVIVATEAEAIREAVLSWGLCDCEITSADCRTGSDRVGEVLRKRGITEGIVINLQGDAPITPPWVVQGMVDEMKRDPESVCVTPAVELTEPQLAALVESKRLSPSSGTTVVTDLNRNALYFSKTVLPFSREKKRETPVLRHIGLYGYRAEFLLKYLTFPATPLESAEKLEQLRILEHGYKIRVVKVDYRGRTHASVDAPSDVIEVERIIAEEGELPVATAAKP